MDSIRNVPSKLIPLYIDVLESLESVSYDGLFAEIMFESNASKENASECFAHGLYYGYPECCSMAFAMGWNGVSLRQHMPERDNIPGVGMVTCPKCTRKLADSADPLTACENFRNEIQARRKAYWDVHGEDDLLFAYLDPTFEVIGKENKSTLFFEELYEQLNTIANYFSLGGLVVPCNATERISVSKETSDMFDFSNDPVLYMLENEVSIVHTTYLKKVTLLDNEKHVSVIASKEFSQYSRMSFKEKCEHVKSVINQSGLKPEDVLIAGQTSLSYWDNSVKSPVILLQPTTREAWAKMADLPGFEELKPDNRNFPMRDLRSTYLIRYADMMVLDSSLFSTGFTDQTDPMDIAEEIHGLCVTDEAHSYVAAFTLNYFGALSWGLDDILDHIKSRETIHPVTRENLIDMLRAIYS